MDIKNYRLLLSFVLIFSIGFILGQWKDIISNKTQSLDIHEVRAKGYTYISPLLRIDLPQQESDTEAISLKDNLEQYVSNIYQQSKASQISVYFRNPSHNRWFSINEKEKYTPASAMKVVTLMAYLKRAETVPLLLEQQITFDKPFQPGGYNFPPQKDIEVGKAYTVWELLNYMITYSSNDAKDLLAKYIDPLYINKVLEDLQLETLDYQEPEDFMNIYTYSSFFRTLYNSSYLSDGMSEKALELLTKSTFTQGLAGGLPPEVVVAHKFGERNNLDTGFKQLHDCGIVYYPDNNYILCVMTKGTSFDDLKQVIQTISTLTYRKVNTWSAN